ncbi:MAG TPA: GAF domain-containing protein [Gemmatimonadaceae bacterium]|nr:GAF domain-containing protein [Gemmatimonadaceae bacterium]
MADSAPRLHQSGEQAVLEALDALRAATVLVDANWVVQLVNAPCARLLRAERGALIGRSLWDVLPFAADLRVARLLRTAMAERREMGPVEIDDPSHPVRGSLWVRPTGDRQLLIELDAAPPRPTASLLGRLEESEAAAALADELVGAEMNVARSSELLAARVQIAAGAGGACVALQSPDGFRVHAAVGTLAPLAGATLPGGGVFARAVQEREVLIDNAVDASASASARVLPSAFDGCAVQQFAIAPLVAGGLVIGAAVVVDSVHGEFTTRHAAVLSRLAAHGALAMRNAQRLEYAEQSARDARALAEVVQDLNQSLELDRAYALIVRHATSLLRGTGARLSLVEEGGLMVIAAHGSAGEIGTTLPVENTLAGTCVRTAVPQCGTAVAAEVTRSAVAAPLLVGGRPLGALEVFGQRPGGFGPHQQDLLFALASHAAVAIENGRLFRSSGQALRHASILAACARSLAFNVTPRAMYADIARAATGSLGTSGVGIFLLDEALAYVTMAYSVGAGAADESVLLDNFWGAGGAMVARESAPRFYPDIEASLRGAPTPEQRVILTTLLAGGVRAAALLPLVIEGRARGVLALRFASPQRFDREQEMLLTDFSAIAAVAMRNALLFGDLERRAVRLSAVATVQQAISGAVDVERVYSEVYRAVASVVDAPGFALLSADAERGVFTPEYLVRDGAVVAHTAGAQQLDGDDVTSIVARTREPTIAAPCTPDWSPLMRDLVEDGRRVVVLAVPILHGDVLLGVMHALSYRSDAFDWSDIDLVCLIARQAATAISNARAFEAERRERRQTEATAGIARLALRGEHIEQTAPALLDELLGVVPAANAALALVTSDGLRMRYVAGRGEAERLVGTTVEAGREDLSLPRTSGAHPGRVLGGIPARRLRLLSEPGETTMLLRSGDRIIGALAVGAGDPERAAERAAALDRLVAPLALAMDALLLRQEERRQQARQRTLAVSLETMEQPVFVFSGDGRIRYANAAAARDYQYALGELAGLDIRSLMPRVMLQPDTDLVTLTTTGQRTWAGERLQRRKDGSEFPAWLTVSAIIDEHGKREGTVVIVRNLSDERRVAEQLRQSEKLAALGELVAGVAHEVNNPLTGISAFAQLLLEDELTDDQLESVRLIKRESDRAVSVIRDLLTFARKTGPRSVTIFMNDLIEQTLRLRTYGIRTTGISVELDLDPALQLVQGDDRQLQQVLLNLVVNAEHAMANSPSRVLTLRTRNDGTRVCVEVIDTGTGMPVELQKRIFEPFFTTKPEGTGTGLGLSVSYGIVRAHGGALSVVSEPGAGATFRLLLPAAAGGDAASRTDVNR